MKQTASVIQRKLGAHLSISGGLYRALERAGELGSDTLQIFLKNSNRWDGKRYSDEDMRKYEDALKNREGLEVFAHSGYLINLAGGRDIRRRSIPAVIDELVRAERLGIPYLVIHPGSHKGEGMTKGIRRIAESIDEVYGANPTSVMILLETTAGQGHSVGGKFEELIKIIELSKSRHMLGICLDTCHIFAAGYDISSQSGYAAMKHGLEKTFGRERIALIHLNDSARECGSRVDRHEHIGKGKIGIAGIANILRDRDFLHIPLILETPKVLDGVRLKEDDLRADRMNIDAVAEILRTGAGKKVRISDRE